MIDRQDFEAYASLKCFNMTVSEAWSAVFDEVLHRLKLHPHALRLLDYGCGDGKYFDYLIAQRGLKVDNVHGVEVSSLRVKRCRQLGWVNVRLIKGDERLPFEDSSFDIVNMMEVIEHIPVNQGVRTLCDVRRVLREGGMLLISTPNYPIKRFYDWSDALLHQKWSRLRDDPTHVTRFTDARMRNLLSQNFSKVEVRPFKPGYLYKRIKSPWLMHKLFFLCTA